MILPFVTDADVDAAIPKTAAHLAAGGLLAYPTETVYGLGSAPTRDALVALARLKGRPVGKPFLLLVSGRTMAEAWGLVFNASARALAEAFWPGPLTLVTATMADKDVEGLLAELEPVLSEIVCTRNSTDRSLDAQGLADVAVGIFGEHRVRVAEQLDDALELGVTLAETGGALGESIGSGGVLVTGSVVTVGEARALLRRMK